jgi:predicted Abi (CAAX) family protease
MEAAKKNMSSFTAKYASDPEAETRKELADMGQALRSKLEAEGSGRKNVLDLLATVSGLYPIHPISLMPF